MRARHHLAVVALLLSMITPSPTTLSGQDDFPVRIDRAVKRGRQYLHQRFHRVVATPRKDYPMGRIALPLTALLKAGMSPRDKLVVTALEKLHTMTPEKTYGVACYLFALDGLWRKLDGDAPGNLRRQLVEKMAPLLKWLVDTRVRGRGNWSYTGGRTSFDYSNSQFAVLGLQVGIEHGFRVPKEVFLEIVHHYVGSRIVDGAPLEIELTFNPPLAEAFTVRYGPRKVLWRGQPAGWNYAGDKRKPYASMTAAGTSNLLVARNALEKLGHLGPVRRKLDSAIHSGMGWIAQYFQDYLGGKYYALYSLEKVGDLGDVITLGGRDWYREGAERILREQRHNGGWGGSVDTSFALLFLTRATRLHMHVMPPPTIYTATADEKSRAQVGDLVFVDMLESFISAREFFEYLRETRKSALLTVAEQVIDNYALDRRDELVPLLVDLWRTRRPDRITRFAKKALVNLTGATGSDPEFYRALHERSVEIVEFLASGSKDVDRIGKLLAATPSVSLKARLLDLIERENLVATVGHLAREILVPDPSYRKRVHGILVRFTGVDLAVGDSTRKKDIESSAQRWRQWWTTDGEGLRREHEIRRWVDLINRDEVSSAHAQKTRDRGELLDALVTAAEAAIPTILDAMERPRYRIELVLALERITGERHGLLVGAWRAWWRKREGGRPAIRILPRQRAARRSPDSDPD